jgi:hypothetical protein
MGRSGWVRLRRAGRRSVSVSVMMYRQCLGLTCKINEVSRGTGDVCDVLEVLDTELKWEFGLCRFVSLMIRARHVSRSLGYAYPVPSTSCLAVSVRLFHLDSCMKRRKRLMDPV